MKITFLPPVVCFVVLVLLYSGSGPARGDSDTDLLKQAEDLVHQAWNPGGDPPSNDQRTDLLNKATDLAKNSPEHRVHGHRVKALLLMKAALEELKNGDPNNKAAGYIRDADSELRESISEAS